MIMPQINNPLNKTNMRTDVKLQNEYNESVRIPRDSRYTNYGVYLPKTLTL